MWEISEVLQQPGLKQEEQAEEREWERRGGGFRRTTVLQILTLHPHLIAVVLPLTLSGNRNTTKRRNKLWEQHRKGKKKTTKN